MLLKHLYLYLSLDEYPHAVVSPFGFRTRYLCNYLERVLATLRFNAEGFSRICVQGRHYAEDLCPIQSGHVVVPSVLFDERQYSGLLANEHHEFFISMLSEGLLKCSRAHNIPIAPLMDGIEAFRAGGHKNVWMPIRKAMRSVGLVAELHCSLDADRFVLTLRVERSGASVFERAILETQPDEIVFGHRFKDIVVRDGELVVVDKFGRPTFSIDIGQLQSDRT